MQKKRIIGYDIIKTIAILSVVLYHFGRVSFGTFNHDGVYYPNVTKVLYELLACCVPLFFMVNGALLADRSVGWGKILKYIILSIFYPVIFYLFLFPLLDLSVAPNVNLKTILFSMEFKGVYWFLFTLGALYAVNSITRHFKIRKYLAILLFITPFISNQIWSFVVLYNPDIIIPFWGHWGVFTLYSFLFFYLGNYLKQMNLDTPKKNAINTILFMGGWFLLVLDVFVFSNYNKTIYDGVNSSFCSLGALLLACSLFMFFKDRQVRNRYLEKLVLFVGRNTMGIYVFHMFFIMILRRYFLPEVISPVFAILICFCIVILCSFISEGLSRTPLKFLFK